MTAKTIATVVTRGLRIASTMLGLALILSATNSVAFGRGVPEIDPGSATSAVTLLVGSMLVFAPRWRRK
jgi:hypothetical protein